MLSPEFLATLPPAAPPAPPADPGEAPVASAGLEPAPLAPPTDFAAASAGKRRKSAPATTAPLPSPAVGFPAGEGEGPVVPPALDVEAFLAGDVATLPARFDTLAAEQLAAEARAVVEARAAVSETAAEAERAALDVPPAERALLRDRTDAAHATLAAARTRLDKAQTTADLARRALAAETERMQAARAALARQMFDAALARLNREQFLREALAPHAEKFWGLLLAVRDQVDAVAALLARRRALVAHGYALAQLAGVDLRALGAKGAASGALDGYGSLRDVDLVDALGAVRNQLTTRAKEARLPAGLSDWLSPWGG